MSSNFLNTMNRIETCTVTYFKYCIEETILSLNSETVPASALINSINPTTDSGTIRSHHPV